MKNIIFIIILLLPQSSFAETWQCRYDFDGEMRTVVLERKGNTFQDMKTNFNFNQQEYSILPESMPRISP